MTGRRERIERESVTPDQTFHASVRQLVAERDRLARCCDLYEVTLRNIAAESWNSGRPEPIALMDYAQAALDVVADSGGRLGR